MPDNFNEISDSRSIAIHGIHILKSALKWITNKIINYKLINKSL
ncbi:hypothetical protein HMPREF0765_0946 [Sphingobacterium spiritivorum ATCC 33300]|uniref:Uncharacterized protein n=1 Tax=Sphingobacterium spiritivorum ATCC 33300 TaxID=525372 RepID=C2FUE0_SPHSI|nr:hypothetical protein HMPREF0765_0946 [Sphingobacterium spiritivorum ATCC 33300]